MINSQAVHILLAFVALTGLIFLNTSGILSPVLDAGRLSVNFLTNPLVKILTPAKNFFVVLSSIRDLAVQNRILTKQVEELSAQVATLEKDRQDNKVLREALSFRSESKHELIPAEIIAFDLFNVDQKLTLNRGSAQGVKAGDPVVSAGNILVGTVSESSEQTSQMDLITSSEVTVNGETSEGKATGVVRGEHGLGLLFDLISRSDSIKPGDKVITSGLGGLFPHNLYIGKIGEIRTRESDLFQKASIVPATNLRSLRTVFILKQ